MVKFHKAFLASIRRHGRISELEMVGWYKLAALDVFSFGDTKVAWEMFKRGKLKLLPENIRNKAQVRNMFSKKKEG